MNIYSIGCSFTFGDELKNAQQSAWPNVLAKKLNGSITNDAVSGGSNQRILYRTIKSIKENYDLYLIAWTTYTRFTFYKSDNNHEINFNPQLRNDIFSKETYLKNWGETLYQVWYNELYAFKLWLQQIICLQSVLQNKPYLMMNTFSNNLNVWLSDKKNFITNTKSLINFHNMTDEQIFEEYEEIQYYLNCIDLSKFYQWHNFSIDSLKKQFPYGPNGHILEQGHQHLAVLLYNHLCSK